ncbi:MAG: DapH/DapD/GlmU-related protein [Desulfuromonadaceae bacterium]|nr:DapH/DapD/GlmU-related protein [Desulfuromonadaceae bacterium]
MNCFTLERNKHVMDLIRTGREMEVETLPSKFTSHNPIPTKSNLLRIWLSLHKMDLPILSSIARRQVQRQLTGSNIVIAPGFRCLYGNITCDNNVALHDTFFVDYANVYIGKGVGFSFQNLVITSTHDLCDMKTVLANEIIIGENVWITSRVIILPGVRIGRNSVIGAGSVVSCDIPPNVFAAGMPAKPIKTIDRGSLYRQTHYSKTYGIRETH